MARPERLAMSPTEVFTERGQIRTVALRWHESYDRASCNVPSWPFYGVGAKLDALDLETATRAEVDATIGNSSWVTLHCDNCEQRDLASAVQVGDEPDYESRTAVLCLECVEAAAVALRQAS
jgi:hypothetical protein